MKRYMLDTNMLSHLVKGHPTVVQHVVAAPATTLCISAITEAEVLFGLAKRPDAKRLHRIVNEVLKHMDILPWDSATAACYGEVRAVMEQQGKVVAALDLLIAAHAISMNTILVTNDQVFRQVDQLVIEDWSQA